MRRTLTAVAAMLAMLGSGVIGGLVATSTGSAGASTSTPVGLVVTIAGRVLDTRAGPKPPGGSTVAVATGIIGADAVAVNITLTDTVAGGFVTAWGSDSDRPNASIINSSGAGESVANYAVVPVDNTGHFNLFTSQPANLVVDLMGYFPSQSSTSATFPAGDVTTSSVTQSAGITAAITRYQTDVSSSTTVGGTVTNAGSSTVSVRVEVRCPDNNVASYEVNAIGAGETKEFGVFCAGSFTTGATIARVVTI